MPRLNDIDLKDSSDVELASEECSEPAPLRVAFHTLGCRSNYADTIDLQAAVLEQGGVPCDFDAPADVYVINTCTVTDNADKDALKLIRKARTSAPDAKVIVTGCMAEVKANELLSLAEVDAVVGPGRKQEVVAAVIGDATAASSAAIELPKEYQSGRRPKKSLPQRRSISLVDPISSKVAGPGAVMGESRTRARFHLRIQEGCENSCTFCIIPQTRGRLSSRAVSDILKDIEHLAAVGYREIVLTGTHIGGYGEDIGSSFHDLLTELERSSAIRRIRISSIDPNDLDKRSVDLMAKSSVFCHHLHICVQSFTDYTLKRMNRRYRMAEVFDLLDYVQERLPNCCLGSDVIVGFPGECRQEVDQGIETFLTLPFSYLHIFPYSERTGTAATRLDGTIDYAERKRRSARWRSLAERRRESYARDLVGREVEIIVEQFDGSIARGTSREFVTCGITVANSEDLRIGQTLRAAATRYDEEGRILLCE